MALTQFRFGKRPPRIDYRTLRLKKYLKPGIAAPPPSYDVLANVEAKLGTSDVGKLFPMDGNDTLGDCTIAAVAHAVTTFRALVGKKTVPSQKSVVKRYMHLTGGVDSGLAELDVLNDWRKNAFDGDKILAFVAVDPKNHTHVEQAIRLFGGVYLGFQVQEGCLEDFDARKAWTPAPLTTDGHAVFAVGYDAKGVTVLTWGNTQRGTWGWWDECVDEAHAILPPEAAKPSFAPGFDFKALKADLADVAQ
jgi:hypothetical protein